MTVEGKGVQQGVTAFGSFVYFLFISLPSRYLFNAFFDESQFRLSKHQSNLALKVAKKQAYLADSERRLNRAMEQTTAFIFLKTHNKT